MVTGLDRGVLCSTSETSSLCQTQTSVSASTGQPPDRQDHVSALVCHQDGHSRLRQGSARSLEQEMDAW